MIKKDGLREEIEKKKNTSIDTERLRVEKSSF